MTTVGIAIPSIAPRRALLQRALQSVTMQTHPVAQISVALDLDREGAGATRNRAKNLLTTDWVGFLDDDDVLLPHHVECLLGHAEYHNADVAFSWFEVLNGQDPFPDHRWIEFNPATPHIFGITALVRREVAQSIDFQPPSAEWQVGGEDWTYWTTLAKQGAKFVNTSEITWQWEHGSSNTSGRPENVQW